MLELRGVSKTYGDDPILQGVDLDVQADRTVSILGRSGSGKTTLLKIVAGLTAPDTGHIRLDGRTLDGVPARERGAVYLYQEPLLFPHLDVFDNVAFGLRLRKLPEDQVRRRTREMLERLGIAEHAGKTTARISGGQRQRTAFGRALIVGPRVLLLDEPFGALDAETRESMQKLFRGVASELRITSLFVTHDLKEAITVGDRFAHLQRGRLTVHHDLAAFVADPRSGAAEEIRFWGSLAPGPPEDR